MKDKKDNDKQVNWIFPETKIADCWRVLLEQGEREVGSQNYQQDFSCGFSKNFVKIHSLTRLHSLRFPLGNNEIEWHLNNQSPNMIKNVKINF